MKALGVGLGAFAFRDVEVVKAPSGAPSLALTGRAAELAQRRGVTSWHVSLTHTGLVAEAVAVLARLREQWQLTQPHTTFSSGLAICRPDRSNEDTLIAADAALYVSKNSGRNRDHVELLLFDAASVQV